MGLVAYRGKWERPDQVSRQVQDDPERKARIQEYLQRRVQLRERADDHWKLAIWCEQNGLERAGGRPSSPGAAAGSQAGERLEAPGLQDESGGHWIKPEEAAAAKAEAQQQQKANNHWKPILERLRNGLQSKDGSRRAEAEKALSQISDRRAVPMVWATFGRGDASLQKVAVQVLGQIDDPSASRSLVMLAVFSGSADVRQEGDRDVAPARCAGVCRASDRDDSAADQVRGQAGRRSGPAGRALDQGAGIDDRT